MNKELFSYFFVILALLVGALFYNNAIVSPIISSLNFFKSSYHNSIEYVSSTIDQHFFQADEIHRLKEKLKQYENNHLLMQELASEISDLYKENKSPLKTDPRVSLVRTIAYEKFANINRLWVDFPEYNSSKIYALIHKELVAGIVINKNGKPLALLNHDIKSTYAVYVGTNKAPGIARGNNDDSIIINFIPTWFSIKKGDEVISSGLDNIFFKGLKVGTVLSVTSAQGYQTAIVKPYFKAHEPSYFHIIRAIK